MSNDKPPARLLDLTRSLRRVGRTATGIDRVEAAYLKHLLADDVPLFALARTPLGYLLIGPDGLAELAPRLQGNQLWGKPDILSRFSRGQSTISHQVESDFRRCAVSRARPSRLPVNLKKHLPTGTVYFNVGHSNLTDRVFTALKSAGLRVTVMVHDVIPLEFPEYQRPGTVEPFREKLRRIQTHADVVLYNSTETQNRAELHQRQWGPPPDAIVVHLGVDVAAPKKDDLPPGLPPVAPYFICVGTIEPRKNHTFLLDLWQQMGIAPPQLLICGNRGWNNDAVFARLDAQVLGVRELSGIDDAAIAALVQGAQGLLFPSHAEGFGLPAVEALALGTRVLCNDLPVFREILGNSATLHSVSDPSQWLDTVKLWAKSPAGGTETTIPHLTSWKDHFKTVLTLN